MQIIISHVNTDFDALASMIAAKKLYPDAQVVISDKQNIPVGQFLAIYRDKLDLVQDKRVDWSSVTELIMVDEASLTRIGDYIDQLEMENLTITVYDHHIPKDGDVKKDDGVVREVGAAVTLLIEEIKRRRIHITPFEATLFGLGIYTDTGAFTFSNTTSQDFEAAGYLMEQGMNLEIVHRFSDEIFSLEQQEVLNDLFKQLTTYYIEGLQIVVSSSDHDTFQKGLATLTRKLLELTDADAAISVVRMKNRIYIVGRASSDRINLQPLLQKWRGGGHEQAGSATVKSKDRTERETILNGVVENLGLIIKPAVTARDMMTSPVKTILPRTTIEESGRLMYRYGHSGFPVVEDEQLLGIITRRDLEKASHHGLGHAPVKAYMTTNIVSISPGATEEEIQKMIIERNIGRLPVVEEGKLIGIVSRTNIIEMLHKQTKQAIAGEAIIDNLQVEMERQLPIEVYKLLKDIGQAASDSKESVYLIGGIVRDLFLKEPNDDIDIVVEGDGIAFSKRLQADYGGEVTIHESFGTATWIHPSGLEIDVTTSRLEYYDRPAALPDVEISTLKEDLNRRDFTFNAMAIYLNEIDFGRLIDPFQGQSDLQEKKLKVLHNLSFIEDPTRILRGVRFETRFQFLMDDQTEKLAIQSIERVKDLSVNRLMGEMKQVFGEANAARSLHRLFELEFWQQFEVDGKRIETSSAHAEQLQFLYTQSTLNEKPSWFDYFFIPFYDQGSISEAEYFALTKRNMKFIQEIKGLKEFKEWDKVEELGSYQRLLKEYSDEALMFYISGKSLQNESLIIEYIQKRKNIPTLLTGADLIKSGLKPGARFAELLLELEVAILNDIVSNKPEAERWLEKQLNVDEE